jgi:hypothetical protein
MYIISQFLLIMLIMIIMFFVKDRISILYASNKIIDTGLVIPNIWVILVACILEGQASNERYVYR